ncbi:hypothetical protein [Okeania sp. SIO3I5]|uniref:hypothetical protein n=1 Tax=Okeania sp. SIO3I5 TaxID=2607805 RepID=UPI0025CEF96D|nr:hypothetical protein [Okeania sp. SIO3I5]
MATSLLSLDRQKDFFPGKTYEYNYSYLPPLAITNVPELLGFPILPEGAFPSIIWIFKVLFSLIIIVINNYLDKQENSGIDSQNDWAELSR